MEVNFSQFLEAGSLRSELLTWSVAGEGPLPGMSSRGLNGLMNRERERESQQIILAYLPLLIRALIPSRGPHHHHLPLIPSQRPHHHIPAY